MLQKEIYDNTTIINIKHTATNVKNEFENFTTFKGI